MKEISRIKKARKRKMK